MSTVTSGLTLTEPALFTKMWSLGRLAITSAARARICVSEAKSQSINETACDPEGLFTVATAASPLPRRSFRSYAREASGGQAR
jgi:hypothetical protein